MFTWQKDSSRTIESLAKLESFQEKSIGKVEIIDIKLEPNEIECLLEQDGFYSAYHNILNICEDK